MPYLLRRSVKELLTFHPLLSILLPNATLPFRIGAMDGLGSNQIYP